MNTSLANLVTHQASCSVAAWFVLTFCWECTKTLHENIDHTARAWWVKKTPALVIKITGGQFSILPCCKCYSGWLFSISQMSLFYWSTRPIHSHGQWWWLFPHMLSVRPSVRPHFSQKNKFQAKTMGLAEWIIDHWNGMCNVKRNEAELQFSKKNMNQWIIETNFSENNVRY